jgi:hypothetical protein
MEEKLSSVTSPPSKYSIFLMWHQLSLLDYWANLSPLKDFFSMARQPLVGLGRLSFRGFTITHFRHTTLGRTPLDEGPARRRDLYLTTYNTHKRQTSMPPVGFFFGLSGVFPL